MTLPVSIDEFTARLRALNVPDRFAIAVSGGRDSMALARLAADYSAREKTDVLALIVDHCLREGSGDDAKKAAQWVEAMGLSTHILRRKGPAPDTGVQEFARNARYRLLAEAANEAGITTLLTAHSATDQAETVFMRLARGGGPRGLAAMTDETLIASGAGKPVRLLRPLLFASRERLTETAAQFEQPYLNDPANDDPAYERVRTRALLASLEEQNSLTTQALCRTAHSMNAAARRLQQSEDDLFNRLGGCFYRWGGASFEISALQDDSDENCVPLMRRVIRAVSGADHPPSEADTALALLAAKETGAASLGGALLEIAKGRLWIYREPAAILGRAGIARQAPLNVGSGGNVLWDNRFIVTNEGHKDVNVTALGAEGVEALGVGLRQIKGPKNVVLSMPGVWHGTALLAVPGWNRDEKAGVSLKSLTVERFSGAIIRF